MKSLYIFYVFLLCLILSACSSTKTSDLDAPVSLTITLIDETRIKLSWSYGGDDANIKYIVSRKEGDGEWVEAHAQTTDNTNYVFDDIETNTYVVYSYKVKAYNIEKETFSEFSLPAAFFSTATQPTGLTVKQISNNWVKLEWKDNAVGEDKYKIDKQINNETWINGYAILTKNTTMYEDSISTLYQTTRYRVYATVDTFSSPKNTAYIVPGVLPPSNLSLVQQSPTQVKLSWDDNTTVETGFYIERKVGNTTWNHVGTVEANVEMFSDNLPIQFGTIFYRVQAYADSITSSYSEEKSIQFNINEIGFLNFSSNCDAFFLKDRKLYIANSYDGLKIVDISNPSFPSPSASIPVNGKLLSIFVDDQYIYLTSDRKELIIYELQNLQTPKYICKTIGNPYNVKVSTIGNHKYAFVADGEAGMLVIDLDFSNAANPRIITRFNTPNNISYQIALKENILFLADGSGGIKKINVSNPLAPVLVSGINDIGEIRNINCQGQLLYVSKGIDGIGIYDLNLNALMNYATPGYVSDFKANYNNRFAFVAAKDGGLVILDISNFHNTFINTQFLTEYVANEVILDGSYVIVLTARKLLILSTGN